MLAQGLEVPRLIKPSVNSGGNSLLALLKIQILESQRNNKYNINESARKFTSLSTKNITLVCENDYGLMKIRKVINYKR